MPSQGAHLVSFRGSMPPALPTTTGPSESYRPGPSAGRAVAARACLSSRGLVESPPLARRDSSAG